MMQGWAMQSNRANILGVQFDLIGYGQALERIDGFRQRGERRYVTLTNPYVAMLCRRDEGVRQALAGASLTLPDGVGIILAAGLLGHKHAGRVTGPGLMLALCDWGRRCGYRHYFYGGQEGVARGLVARLRELYPGLLVAGECCPPFGLLTDDQDAAITRAINASRPDVVWVGLGAPKQEKWMRDHVGRVEAPVMIGVGAAFDFHAGTVKRAPPLVRRLGLEWVYRTACAPRRVFPKAVDNVRFALVVLHQAAMRRLGPGLSP